MATVKISDRTLIYLVIGFFIFIILLVAIASGKNVKFKDKKQQVEVSD